MKSDIEIAQEAVMLPIQEVAAQLDLKEDDLELYGKYKAKLSDECLRRFSDQPDGKLILVTAINPTPAGEGKTTTSVGLGEAFMCVELMTVGALSGLGRTKLCSIISILLTGSRIPLALLLTHTGLGLNGVWWALTISSVVKGIVFYFAFKKVSSRLE